MIYAIVTVLVLIADQAVKFWTTKNIILNAVGADCKPLIPGIVHMTNVHNTGAAFGILKDGRWPLAVVAALFVILIIVLINKEIIHTRFGRWTAVLVMAGALGNCIDRVLYGYVVDMFEVEFMNFAVFNVADIFITVCGILFCLHLIFYNEPEAVRQANEPEFMRRRRAEREAAVKEDPYASIPKRGEHTTLEEDLAARDPDDPFGEWDFGAVVEEKPAVREPEILVTQDPDTGEERKVIHVVDPSEEERVQKAKAEKAAKPEKSARAEKPEKKEKRAKKADPAPAEPLPEPEPEEEPAPAEDIGFEIEDFTLEDILSEFGDF